jgi:hypothetical protein
MASMMFGATLVLIALVPSTLAGDEKLATYQEYADGYPQACGTDFIKYMEGLSSLENCQSLCSAESACKFVAYSSTGVRGCGLYKSKCHGQTHSACSSSECYNTYEQNQYWYFGAGHPRNCLSDYIRNEVNIASLQDCLGVCSDESECHFVAYNKLGDRRCGLYKSSCNGQEQIGCNLSQCYVTYTDYVTYIDSSQVP